MKYKLTTLPRGTAKLPVLDLGYAAITMKQGALLVYYASNIKLFR